MEEMLGEAEGVMKSLERGKKVSKRKAGIYFENLFLIESFRNHSAFLSSG